MRGHAALNARVRAGVDAWAAYEGCLLAYSSASTDMDHCNARNQAAAPWLPALVVVALTLLSR